MLDSLKYFTEYSVLVLYNYTSVILLYVPNHSRTLYSKVPIGKYSGPDGRVLTRYTNESSEV